MAATALIKLTQGPNTDLPGVAVLGTLVDGAVVVTNGDNTDVASWEIHVTEVPPGSLFVPGMIASGVSATPVGVFVPDVDGGCYRILLVVRDGLSNEDKDLRCFGIVERRGFLIPPPQLDPPPIKTKPNELNFQGQPKGWAGDRFFPFTNAVLRSVLDSQYDQPFLPNPAALIPGDTYVYTAGFPLAVANVVVITGGGGFIYAMDQFTFYMTEIDSKRGLASRLISTAGGAGESVLSGIADFPNVIMANSQGGAPVLRLVTLNGSILSSSPTLSSTPGPAMALSPGFAWVTYPFNDITVLPIIAQADRATVTTVTDSPVYGGTGVSSVMDIVYDPANDKIWVSSAGNNVVLRIDPTTMALEVTVSDVNLQSPQAMIIAAGFLWVTNVSALNVMRISIPGGTVFDLLTNPAIQQPTDITHDPIRNKIWVLDTFFNTLVRIDAATNTYDMSVPLPGAPADNQSVVFLDNYLWVSNITLNVLYKIDPVSFGITVIGGLAPGFIFNRSNASRDSGVTLPDRLVTNQDGVVFYQGGGNIALPDIPAYDGETHTIVFNPLTPPLFGYEPHVAAVAPIIGETILAYVDTIRTFKWSAALGSWVSM